MSDPGAESTLRRARQEAYRALILDAAEPVFAEYGYEAAKVQEIAASADVSVGTIYGVFGSKAELYSAVMTRRLPDILGTARDAAATATTTLERLTRGLDAAILYMLEHTDFLRIHLHESAWGLGPRRAPAEQLVAWRQGMELEALILGQAMDEGLVIRCDPARLARMIAAVQQVHLADWVDGGMVTPGAEVAERLRRLFVLMFCTDRSATP